MIIGGTVKSISDHGSYTFVDIECGMTTVKLQMKSDDPRIQAFRFRAQMMVEISPVEGRKVIELTKAA